uniref:CCHC-type domain-containing protein n=1 Tax=Leptobrachium leishanense TaxID=445787 RepID=A0A8C5MMS7_9ANUR
SPLAMIGPEFIVAIGDLLAKCQRTSSPHTNFGYRWLRNFTGNVPTPAGEETFEEWVEQAMQALDEWDIPEAQKKQRITESLRLGSDERIFALSQDCTALDYLNVLQEVFGQTEKAAELMYQYEHTYQRKGEKMTEYMRRLDKILHQILLKKGAEPATIDKIRMQQILREGNRELKYLELIQAVRGEEALLEEKSLRRGERAYAQSVRHNEYLQTEDDSEIHKTVKKVQEAQAELKQAHTDLCRVLLKVAETQTDMQKFLTDMQTTGVAVVSGQGPSAESLQVSAPPSSKKRCFSCGEMGHFRAQCKNQRPEGNKVEEFLKALEGLLSTSQAGNARGSKTLRSGVSEPRSFLMMDIYRLS